jgi:hypothetical protein
MKNFRSKEKYLFYVALNTQKYRKHFCKSFYSETNRTVISMKLQTSSWPPDNFSNFDTNNSAQLHQIQLSIFHYLGHFLLLLLPRELTLLLVIMVCLGRTGLDFVKFQKKFLKINPNIFTFLYHINHFLSLFK